MELKKAPLYEMTFNEEDEFGKGVTAMGVVSDPAIMQGFFAFSQDGPKKLEFKVANEAKQMLVGPAMIPNLPIYRRDDEGEEYYVYASKETVKRLAYSFIKQGRQNNATIEHEMPAEGVRMVETWIVEDVEKDKQAAFGMRHPKGTWMIAMKVDSAEVWAKFIETGELTGFSIEGYMGQEHRHKQVQRVDEGKVMRAAKALSKLAVNKRVKLAR